jgi:hypothetical protein
MTRTRMNYYYYTLVVCASCDASWTTSSFSFSSYPCRHRPGACSFHDDCDYDYDHGDCHHHHHGDYYYDCAFDRLAPCLKNCGGGQLSLSHRCWCGAGHRRHLVLLHVSLHRVLGDDSDYQNSDPCHHHHHHHLYAFPCLCSLMILGQMIYE